MAHALWQQRCLEVGSRLRHVGVVDETRRTCRHHGRQRDAPRHIVTFRHATLRVAPHRYATLEPLAKPGGSRALARKFPSSACGSETFMQSEIHASGGANLCANYLHHWGGRPAAATNEVPDASGVGSDPRRPESVKHPAHTCASAMRRTKCPEALRFGGHRNVISRRSIDR